MEVEDAAMARAIQMDEPEIEQEPEEGYRLHVCIGRYDAENHNCTSCYDGLHCYHQTEPRDKK